MPCAALDCTPPPWYTFRWIVKDEEERQEYEASGGPGTVAVVGGGLCASRNLAIDLAAKKKAFCVQISDDVHGLQWLDPGQKRWVKPRNLSASNQVAAAATQRSLSALGAAQLVAAEMRAIGAKLGGVRPNANPGQAFMTVRQLPVSSLCPPCVLAVAL